MRTSNFEDLVVWQKAHEFVLFAYKITSKFPKEELFGLTNQFRRAAVSIPANIAEGYRKSGIKDKLRFYNISAGSADECRYYIILAKDLNLIDQIEYDNLYNSINIVSKLLTGYCKGIINQTNSND